MGGPREGADSQERAVLAASRCCFSHLSCSLSGTFPPVDDVCPTLLSLLGTKGLRVLASALPL